jgi:RHS repeat-associated protein
MVTSTIGGVTTTYTYDGDGRRVQKSNPSGTTTYVYDAAGQLAAEYGGAPSQWATSYLTTDHLGSTRMVTDGTGTVQALHDFLPFGEEITAGTPTARLARYYPASPLAMNDGVTEKFTGKERDGETGLDYFGARYFSAAQGRFTIPDWPGKPQPVPYAKLENPQSLNLYAYVLNNPLSRMDPDGHIDCSGKNAQGVGCQAIAEWNAEHGIGPTANRSTFPGVEVKLPNGKKVPDPHSPTGYLMAPTADLSNVAAAGRKLRKDIAEALDVPAAAGSEGAGAAAVAALYVLYNGLKDNLSQGGEYDDQRIKLPGGGFQRLPNLRDAANFNVGLFAQQAGLSLDEILTIAGHYASGHSSNYSPNEPYGLSPQTREMTELGYQTGESGVYGN